MRKNLSRAGLLAILALFLVSCSRKVYHMDSYVAERTEISSRFDKDVPQSGKALLATYKAKVDSIMSPVVAQSAQFMSSSYPENLLSNLLADVIRERAEIISGRKADVSIMNLGGIRNSLPKGPVTYGAVFEITPFENSLAILEMKGSGLRKIFGAMAAGVKGSLSGGRIVRTRDGKLKSAEVGGKPLDDDRVYTVATIDYLAEGNDGFDAFKGCEAQMPEGATLRQMFLDYLKDRTDRGEMITSSIDGRFTIE